MCIAVVSIEKFFRLRHARAGVSRTNLSHLAAWLVGGCLRAVMRYLIERGVEPNRLRARGFGETRPLCGEHEERCWSKNRRVDFVFVGDAKAKR
jgi:hypothetical protein